MAIQRTPSLPSSPWRSSETFARSMAGVATTRPVLQSPVHHRYHHHMSSNTVALNYQRIQSLWPMGGWGGERKDFVGRWEGDSWWWWGGGLQGMLVAAIGVREILRVYCSGVS